MSKDFFRLIIQDIAQPAQFYLLLNLHLMTDSKALHPCHIQSRSPFYHLPDRYMCIERMYIVPKVLWWKIC